MAQVRQGLDDEDKSLLLNVFATANPPQPAELPCLGRAWIDEDKIMVVNVFANANPLGLLNLHVWDAHGWRKSFLNPSTIVLALEWDLMDIDGVTHFLLKNLVEFERDLLHGMFVSQQCTVAVAE